MCLSNRNLHTTASTASSVLLFTIEILYCIFIQFNVIYLLPKGFLASLIDNLDKIAKL